LTLEESSRAV